MFHINPPEETDLIKIRAHDTMNIIASSCYNLLKQKTFVLDGVKYNYFFNKDTWNDERVIELPIIWDMVSKYKNKSILEVGNVLSHYYPIDHDVVDKYEVGEGIINSDIVEFKPEKKYDLVVSISTFEHIGYDEEPYKQPQINADTYKIIDAIENIKSFLVPGGKLVFTAPLGYSPCLDYLLYRGKIKFTKSYYMKRISKDNKWSEVGLEEAHTLKYHAPYPAANGLLIGIIDTK